MYKKKFRNLLPRIVLSAYIVVVLTGCGANTTSTNEENTTIQQVVEQMTTEEDDELRTESNEEAYLDSTDQVKKADAMLASLSNEEWVDALNIQMPTFIIFNEVNGNRQVLENGQKYTLQEGDLLAVETPPRTYMGGMTDDYILCPDSEIKYGCRVFYLNWNYITIDTEFTLRYTHEETEEKADVTVYLSKEDYEKADFETWAKLKDNDEVCMVRWNTVEEKPEILTDRMAKDLGMPAYEIQEGDRYAIPYRENITEITYFDYSLTQGDPYIYNGKEIYFENTDYLELSLKKTGYNHSVLICFIDETGEVNYVTYTFK